MKLVTLPLLLVIFSCGEIEPKKATEEITTTSLNSATSDEATPVFSEKFSMNLTAIKKTISIFYNEIVLQKISPEVVANIGGYYEVELSSYVHKLDSLNIFDSSFIESEKLRLQPCIADLNKMKASENDDYDGIWQPRSCFSDYLYWLNAQDEPDDFEITEGNSIDNQFEAIVQFVSINDGKKGYWDYSQLKINLIRTNDNIVISKVLVEQIE